VKVDQFFKLDDNPIHQRAGLLLLSMEEKAFACQSWMQILHDATHRFNDDAFDDLVAELGRLK